MIIFENYNDNKTSNLIVNIDESFNITSKIIPEEYINKIKNYLNKEKIEFKNNKIKSLNLIEDNLDFSKIILVFIKKEASELELQETGAKIFNNIKEHKIKEISLDIDISDQLLANILFGIKTQSYNFNKYITKLEDNIKPKFFILTNDTQKLKAEFNELSIVADGMNFCRDLVTETPNILTPEHYANLCSGLKNTGLSVKILKLEEIKQLGMGALLGVAQGSANEPRVVIMEWEGKNDNFNEPIAFVGKGVTFDTGGISLKPASGMEKMKYDMAGSASVVGIMKVLAERKAPVNAVGIIGLVENMPSSTAQRPSDVVKSMSGKTIEVLNTDAEGRLVLADILHYAQVNYYPKTIIDLATLTGAIIVALGREHAGIFSNDDKLSQQLYDAGIKTNEKVWRLPMGDNYEKLIKSKIADIQNISNSNSGAGSITAGEFLKQFIINNTSWAHIDIAGVAWQYDNKKATYPEGASGFGVKLLNELAKKYES